MRARILTPRWAARRTSGINRSRHFSDEFRSGISGIDPIPQFLSGLEVGDVFGGYLNSFTGLGVTPCPWRTVIQGETAEAPDFNALAFDQCVGDGFKEFFDGNLGILDRELREAGRQGFNEFGTGLALDSKGEGATMLPIQHRSLCSAAGFPVN